MQYQCGANVLELVSGDICTQRLDAIVNAANEQLAAGGGVHPHHLGGGPVDRRADRDVEVAHAAQAHVGDRVAVRPGAVRDEEGVLDLRRRINNVARHNTCKSASRKSSSSTLNQQVRNCCLIQGCSIYDPRVMDGFGVFLLSLVGFGLGHFSDRSF